MVSLTPVASFLPYLMGMSFMISRNMEGDTMGSQLLGSKGSEPLSTTFRSSIQRLKDSRGGSIPEGRAREGQLGSAPFPKAHPAVNGGRGADVTLPLLAELPVMLPQLQHQLGAEQLHVRVRGQHI